MRTCLSSVARNATPLRQNFYTNGEEKDEPAHGLACPHAHNHKTVIYADPGFWSRHQWSRGAVESDR